MKKCPACGRLLEDDNIFCIDDGTPLIPVPHANPNRVVIPVGQNPPPSPEIPTQFVPRFVPLPNIQSPQPPNNAPDNSKFLYTVIGALVAVIFFIGIGFFVLRNVNEKDTVQSSNHSESSSGASTSSSPNENKEESPANSMKKPEKPTPRANTSSMNTMSNMAPATNAKPNNDFRLTRNFNRTFSGTADNDGISMRLQRSGSSLGGKVYSRKSVTQISVSGTIYDDGSFEMGEYSDIGEQTGTYQGRINSDGTMSGTWTKPDGSKPRSFFMRSN